MRFPFPEDSLTFLVEDLYNNNASRESLDSRSAAFGKLSRFCIGMNRLPYGVGSVMSVASGVFDQLQMQSDVEIQTLVLAVDVALISEIFNSIDTSNGFGDEFWTKVAGKLHMATLRLVSE